MTWHPDILRLLKIYNSLSFLVTLLIGKTYICLYAIKVAFRSISSSDKTIIYDWTRYDMIFGILIHYTVYKMSNMFEEYRFSVSDKILEI